MEAAEAQVAIRDGPDSDEPGEPTSDEDNVASKSKYDIFQKARRCFNDIKLNRATRIYQS